jgi:aminodeoxyfutalosine deaminase
MGGAHRALVVHGNYLGSEEIGYLAERAERMATVYCPRTHAFFNHPPHPVAELLSRGAAVALGTDSRASNPDLSIWNEVRWLLEQRPDLDVHKVLAMATLHGADALMRPGLGRIAPGAHSGLLAVPGHGDRPEDLIPAWITSGAPRVLTP